MALLIDDTYNVSLLRDARRVFQLAMESWWWSGFIRKGFLEGVEYTTAKHLRRWVSRVVWREMSFREYRRIVHVEEGKGVISAAFFARDDERYVLLYILLSDFYKTRIDGEKAYAPLSMAIHYGLLDKKYVGVLDRISPYVRRRLISHGYWMEARRYTDRYSLEAAGDEWMKTGSMSLLLRENGVEKTLWLGTKCFYADTVFRQYKAKIILFIPPLIIWKWGHMVTPVSLIDKHPAADACVTIGKPL